MPVLKSKFAGAAAATAAAVLVAFAPPAQSTTDELWRQLEITDGYTPSPLRSPAMKMEAAPRSEQKSEFVGTGARTMPEAAEVCDRWAEQLRLSDGYTPRC